ncbi:MAG: YtxH domain-containing protein [bacterium]
MSRNSDNSVSFGIGILFGVLTGVAAGILFSPKSGEKMREELKETVNKFSKDIPSDLAKTKTVSLDMINKLKYTIEKQIVRINESIKAGKMAAAKTKEELESGYNY